MWHAQVWGKEEGKVLLLHPGPLQWGTQHLLGLPLAPVRGQLWVNLVFGPYLVDPNGVFWPHDPPSAAPPTDVVIWRKESDSMYDASKKDFCKYISFHCCTGFVHQVRFAFLIGWTLILGRGSIVHPSRRSHPIPNFVYLHFRNHFGPVFIPIPILIGYFQQSSIKCGVSSQRNLCHCIGS